MTESVLAEFTVRSPVFAESFEACPGTRAIYVQETDSEDGAAWMAFWIVGDADGFAAALEADPTVGDFNVLAEAEKRTLFRVEVAEEYRRYLTYRSFVDADAVVLSSVADTEGWRVRARFPSREALTGHRERCRNLGVEFELQSVYTAAAAQDDPLTSAQREALVAALEMGYFEVPREATAGDVAERLGITKQAVSERLRRALRTAAEHTLREE